jgi:DNA-binding LacI/PurR family transcriptional regulator
MESGTRAAQMLLQNDSLPSALYIVNDLMAIGVVLALQEAGYNIPEDIAVVGFDNIPEATIIRPALTTIAQNPRDIGKKLVESLFDRIHNPTTVKRKLLESTFELIIRDSA